MSGDLTPGRWRALLDEAFTAGRAHREITEELEVASSVERSRLAAHRNHHRTVIAGLLAEYRDRLPRPAISRDPFSKKPVHHSLDTYGLEGFWWNYDGATRPTPEEGLPPTFFALTGAVYLQGHVAPAPFLCKPGPEVPYVLGRILGHPDVRAVLSSMPIGDHWGYAVTYFAKPTPWLLPRVNDWGANIHWFRGQKGEWGWDDEVLLQEHLDFELEWWIEQGKLLWITPGDGDLTLRSTVDDCPYLGLPGRQSILRIEDGTVWTRQEVR